MKFSFEYATEEEVSMIVNYLNTSKPTSGFIPFWIIKKANNKAFQELLHSLIHMQELSIGPIKNLSWLITVIQSHNSWLDSLLGLTKTAYTVAFVKTCYTRFDLQEHKIEPIKHVS